MVLNPIFNQTCRKEMMMKATSVAKPILFSFDISAILLSSKGAFNSLREASEIAPLRLLTLDRFEQGLDVLAAEAARAFPLDDLKKERRAALHRPGKDL